MLLLSANMQLSYSVVENFRGKFLYRERITFMIPKQRRMFTLDHVKLLHFISQSTFLDEYKNIKNNYI